MSYGKTEVYRHFDAQTNSTIEERVIVRYKRCTITPIEALAFSSWTAVIGWAAAKANLFHHLVGWML